MEYITKEELIISEVYTHQNGNICRCDRNSNTSIYGKYINITHNVFRKPPENPGNFAINEMRLATPEEKHWLETCITADKFITFEEAMKTFVPEYVECILPELWKRTIKENNGNLIFKSDFKSTCALQIKDKLLDKTQSSFKPSTKEAYDAQFIVKEPEFVLPERWCIGVTNKSKPYIKKYRKSIGYEPYNIGNYDYQTQSCGNNEIKGKELTLEEFKKYVLKEEIIEEIKVIEPLPHFKVIETIETITKVENNEGNQFFIGDVVKSSNGTIQTIESFDYNKSKTNIIAFTNKQSILGNGIGIDKIEHYIEPKVEFILPEKWAILRTNENDKVVTNYINSISSIDHVYLNNNRHNPYLHNITNGCCSSYKIFTNYTEITFDQFKKYILK